MNKEEKTKVIEDIASKLEEYPHIYLTDATGLNAEETTKLRRMCFKNDIRLMVVKNTLLEKAFAKSEKELDELKPALKQQTAIMFSHVGNAPAKLISDFRGKKGEVPSLKAAYVEESVYFGDDQLKTLSTIKSKDELVADVVALLQSPMTNLLSQLNSGKHILAGITKTLSEK